MPPDARKARPKGGDSYGPASVILVKIKVLARGTQRVD
jgi:hypothetical protein